MILLKIQVLEMKEDAIIVLIAICLMFTFFHKIEAHITIYCKRTSQNEYLVTIPIKNNLEDIFTNIRINNN